jgi:DNA modification methylase
MAERDKVNYLYYGDNLDVLRRHIKDETVDLVYLDPPFNSKASYNVLYAEHNGTGSKAQIKAFEDTWHWELAAETYHETVERGGKVADALRAFRTLLGDNDMLAYLSMMAPRLVELRRVLKPTGSIYLHCDPTASHYLKMLMDGAFGPERFLNELVWKRSSAHSDAKQGATHYGRVTDTILFYAKGEKHTWNQLHTPYDPAYVDRDYRRTDPDGRRYRISDLSGPGGASKGNPLYEFLGVTRYWRYGKGRMEELHRQGHIVQTRPGAVPQLKRYLDEMPGVPVQNLWIDVPVVNNRSHEKLGYATQKPEALLERIIRASSNEGDLVLDPFCGCGTAVSVAQRLGRAWIGIDITHLAIGLIKTRLHDAFAGKAEFKTIGEPTTEADAQTLAAENPYQFQWWALGLVGARPTEEKKGADKGIDGRLYFHEGPDGETKQIVLSVKAGHIQAAHVRDLRGVAEREKSEIGVLVTLGEPTREMRKEAASAGFYESPWGKHPRLQLLTVRELLDGKRIDYPPSQQVNVTYKRAPRAKAKKGEQIEMALARENDERDD